MKRVKSLPIFPRPKRITSSCGGGTRRSRSRRRSSDLPYGRWLDRWTLLSTTPWIMICGSASRASRQSLSIHGLGHTSDSKTHRNRCRRHTGPGLRSSGFISGMAAAFSRFCMQSTFSVESSSPSCLGGWNYVNGGTLERADRKGLNYQSEKEIKWQSPAFPDSFQVRDSQDERFFIFSRTEVRFVSGKLEKTF